MIPDPEERPFMSIDETARVLGLGRSATYDAARRGELPTIRLGRRLLVPTAALRHLAGMDAASRQREEDAADLGGQRGALSWSDPS